MKNSSKKRGRYFIVVGIALAILYCFIEAAIMVFICHEGSFGQQLFAPEPHEFWMRSSVAIVILLFSLYANVNTNRRAQAEEAVQQAARQWQQTFDALDDMIVIIDSDHRIVRANQATLEAFPDTDVVGAHCYEVFHGTEAPIANCPTQQALRTHESARTEICEAHLGGCWLDVYAAPIMGPGGTISQVVHVVHDITERKQAEEALRESEGKYRTLVENLPQKIFFKDRNLVYVSCNEQYARDLGLAPDEIAGHTDYDFYPRELAEKYRADDARIMQSEKTEEIEEDYIQDGQQVVVHTVKTPVRDENGKVAGILGIFWDITERKQAEEELQAAYQRNETIISTSMDGFYTTHPDGNIFDCNAAFCEMVGYSQDELLDMKIGDLDTQLTAEEVGERMQQVMRAGSHRFEIAIRHKDGTLVDLEISTTFVELPDESFFVSFARDISENRRLWDELNHQLVRDVLTGVYNRRYFNETIIQEVKRADRYGHHVSFIMGDIDDLKSVNDNCGHLVGDQILQGTAQALEQASRAADIVIRYGGDEFLVIMPETHTEQAHAAVERFEEAFADWLDKQVQDGTIHRDLPADVGFSMGVACYEPDTDVAVEEVLAQADEAMYRVKQAKRTAQTAS